MKCFDETRTAVRKAGVGDDLPYIYMLLAPEFRRFDNEKRSNFRYTTKLSGPRPTGNEIWQICNSCCCDHFQTLAFAAADSRTGDDRTVRQNTSPYYNLVNGTFVLNKLIKTLRMDSTRLLNRRKTTNWLIISRHFHNLL